MPAKSSPRLRMSLDSVVVAAAITTLSFSFGKVVEAILAEEIGKWIVMGIFIIGAFEVFVVI